MFQWDNPTLDYPVQYENTLSHMRLLCPTLDWSVPHETALSHMRLHCPTLDCKSNMRTTRKKVLPFIAKVSLSWDLLSFLGLGLVLGWELDWDLDGTGTWKGM